MKFANFTFDEIIKECDLDERTRFIVILASAAIGLLPSIITGKIVDEALVNKNLTTYKEYIDDESNNSLVDILNLYSGFWASYVAKVPVLSPL